MNTECVREYHIRPFALTDADNFRCCSDAGGWSVLDLLASLTSHYRHTMVATIGDETVGYILWQYVPTEESAQSTMDLLAIEVVPVHRRRGVAAGLLEHLLVYAKKHNVRHCFLEVRENNHPARALYKQLGFCERGRRRNYYTYQGVQHDAIEYCWENGAVD